MPTIELLTLANHAEIHEGLLFLSGAEWNTLTRTYQAEQQPQPHHMGIALSVVTTWLETNQRHRVEIWIEDEDGLNRLLEANCDIEVGRPPGMIHGSDSRSPIALTGLVLFPKQGGYRLQAKIGDVQRSYAFQVKDQITQITQAN